MIDIWVYIAFIRDFFGQTGYSFTVSVLTHFSVPDDGIWTNKIRG